MGRRSINTTKSGKFMNPTDQARKEARKRELKKNKKQRLLVRAAVLKGKDPMQIIADLERLDQMEFNISSAPPLNEKVLKDKRRKLKETWDRLVRLYIKEDPEKHSELKRLESDYLGKKNILIKQYEAVKATQDIVLDEIPLPDLPADASSSIGNEANAVASSKPFEPQSILKKSSKLLDKEPPGVPPGLPPVISDIESDEEVELPEEKTKKVHFDNEANSNKKEADISEFLKEIEQVEKTVTTTEPSTPSTNTVKTFVPAPPPPLPSEPPSGQSLRAVPPPPMYMLRPPLPNMPGAPLMRLGVRPMGNKFPNMPQQPLLQPSSRNAVMYQQQQASNQRLPMPSAHQRLSAPNRQHIQNANARKDDRQSAHIVSDKATIEAKPQLRNLSADSTRFMPTSLRVKRNEKQKKPIQQKHSDALNFYSGYSGQQSEKGNQPTNDDAYEVFMKELQGLL